MKVEKIGSRGILFTIEAHENAFEEDYFIYLINGENNVYLCDTHLGPESMKPIKEYMHSHGLDQKPLVLFFSHTDYDHIWGACAFPGATIIAHDRSLQRIFDRGQLDLQRYGKFQNGDVKLVYPNLTFDSRISFREDGVDFIFAPGHTNDSAVCYDRRESVLYVGDLVERPQPVILEHDLETYIETLENLKGMAAKVMIASHSGRVNNDDIDKNIEFIREFQDTALSEPTEDDTAETVMIRKMYTLLMYEEAIQQTAGDSFDYMEFQKELWGSLELDYLSPRSALLRNVEHEELRLALESYMAGL